MFQYKTSYPYNDVTDEMHIFVTLYFNIAGQYLFLLDQDLKFLVNIKQIHLKFMNWIIPIMIDDPS